MNNSNDGQDNNIKNEIENMLNDIKTGKLQNNLSDQNSQNNVSDRLEQIRSGLLLSKDIYNALYKHNLSMLDSIKTLISVLGFCVAKNSDKNSRKQMYAYIAQNLESSTEYTIKKIEESGTNLY